MSDASRPRILFEDVPADLAPGLQELAGTHGAIFTRDNVHDSDWDLLVSFAPEPFVGNNLPTLSFGGTYFSPTRDTSLITWRTIREEPSLAREVHVAADAPWAALLERSIVANDPGPGRLALQTFPRTTNTPLVPLVTAGREEVMWAALLRYRTGFIWALPAETTEHVSWLAEVLRYLHTNEPDRYPGDPDWRRSAAWAAAPVSRVLSDLETIGVERRAALAELDVRESEAGQALEREMASAAAGEHRLLTASGDDLVAAVADALASFGFVVQDMDDHHDANSGGKLEDLRVTTGEEVSSWTCLVEIKGYLRGAKVSEVAQIIGRPARGFRRETGRDPDRLWHIVNTFREQNPSTRPVPFSGSADLAVLAENDGCAIDTRDLFRAQRDVESGAATAEDVKQSLISSLERWTWPSEQMNAEAANNSDG